MMQKYFAFGLAVLSATLAVIPASAQTEPKVRDLTGRDYDSETLIDVLKPKTEPPPEWLKVRGARSMSAPMAKCDFYKRQTARGITVKPVADIAAVEILFAYDSSTLTPEASKGLDEIGKALSSTELSPCCFRIEGHTDSKGTDDYNLRLSEQRARSVTTYLARRFGIDTDRMLVVGLGEEQPIANNDNEQGRHKNRRVQIVNLGYGEVTP
jgi:outer membrane protein OmpA-like peptidoglycan-associated protein